MASTVFKNFILLPSLLIILANFAFDIMANAEEIKPKNVAHLPSARDIDMSDFDQRMKEFDERFRAAQEEHRKFSEKFDEEFHSNQISMPNDFHPRLARDMSNFEEHHQQMEGMFPIFIAIGVIVSICFWACVAFVICKLIK